MKANLWAPSRPCAGTETTCLADYVKHIAKRQGRECGYQGHMNTDTEAQDIATVIIWCL
jgi:hypothetical protein